MAREKEWGAEYLTGEIEPAGVLGENRARMLVARHGGYVVYKIGREGRPDQWFRETSTPGPDPLETARAVAAYEIGDPSWADVIIAAYLDPAAARENHPDALQE